MTPDVPILSAQELTKTFRARQMLRRRVADDVVAVDGVSIQVQRGTTLGVVGESGSGKTTLARMVTALESATSGRILLGGVDIASMKRLALHRQVQYVFQDPYSALNPRRTIRWSVGVPLRYLDPHDKRARRDRVAALLERTGLRPEAADRFPHELSGGQRQRVVIARALAARPELLVLDEPVSALDVSVQAQILLLLRQLQADLQLTYLFISHDLAVVEGLSDEVAVMKQGKIVEHGRCRQVFTHPHHPYTRTLLAAVPGSRDRRGSQAAEHSVGAGEPEPTSKSGRELE